MCIIHKNNFALLYKIDIVTTVCAKNMQFVQFRAETAGLCYSGNTEKEAAFPREPFLI